MTPTISQDALRSIGALKYDPGYNLLLDRLQAKLDGITNDLANPELTTDQRLNTLAYWQSFREILNDLRVLPVNFFANFEQENSDDPEDNFKIDQHALTRLQAAHQLTAFEDNGLN